ncbi:hypothetical protein [Streptomyces luteireticuli]|uniref:hypothetical protein n=1 Tax=Streptomyces luteireticuli TaxID=173858 RepID=UPI003557C87E
MNLADHFPDIERTVHRPEVCYRCGTTTHAWTFVTHIPGTSGPGYSLYACPGHRRADDAPPARQHPVEGEQQ